MRLDQFLTIAGLHVLSSEPVKIPWFDSVLADIGDEQSLSQSLSTFSGHLKQIGVSWSISKILTLICVAYYNYFNHKIIFT